MKYNKKQILAKDLINVNIGNPNNLAFTKENLNFFVSPLFIEPMKLLMDKNIKTISCGSGVEKNIVPGITCDFNSLNEYNKIIAKKWLFEKNLFRIGYQIIDTTTFFEFENNLIKLINELKNNT